MDEHPLIPYIEPIYRFCRRRLANVQDAEDLASEILCHVLEGMDKYCIASLDAWVWRVAHNRYARFIDARHKSCVTLTVDGSLPEVADDYCAVDTEETERTYESVFRSLHTLSRAYRDIFVDHYLGELSVRALAEQYALSEATVKWRLNVGREKIRARIGEYQMEKIYRRINWNTEACNGSMDADRYLHSQTARAICAAAYERPLTVEEISLATGLPTLYIEDELPRLLYGDAIVQIGRKYATNFIILRLADRRQIEDASAALVNAVADRFAVKFADSTCDMSSLGYIVIPYVLRIKLRAVKAELGLASGPFPPRRDGGYGWFLVEEAADERDVCAPHTVGCNAVEGEDRCLYYYLIMKYYDDRIYRGLHLLQHRASGGMADEDTATLIEAGLLTCHADGCRPTFPTFTAEAFTAFTDRFAMQDDALDPLLADWIKSVRRSFARFVPARLDDQINQWVSAYLQQLISYVTDELIDRGVLRRPDPDRPFTDGVFALTGKGILP